MINEENLKRLIMLLPDPDRSERVRTRCRVQLERNARRRTRNRETKEFTARVVASAALGGFCLLYTVLLVITTLRLEGVFQ
jgi:hypothetical protein